MKRWSKPNGYRDVLAISLPMVASMGSITIMQFTDRLFLANYSLEAIAAALPAGVASFTGIAFFMGVANYTNVFVAQYTGAKAPNRVGAAIWQGIYFSLIAAVLLGMQCFFSDYLFDLIGHSPSIRSLEISYFNVLTLGAGMVVLGSCISCFYTGRGMTWVVMLVQMTGASANIPLDYCLIYGVGPFPELGIKGAGIATVLASGIILVIFCFLIFSKGNRVRFGTWRSKAFDRELFGRLMRYGLPSGVQFFLEVFGFTFFIQMLGRVGDSELAASNIVLSIETLAFLPMVGLHIGNSTLVGQAVGRSRPEEGTYATTSALHITLTYMMLIAAVFIFFPEPLIRLFQANPLLSGQYPAMKSLCVILMRFLALFCFFNALNLVFSGAIKGAGDTTFIMWTVAAISWGVMIIPIYVAVIILRAGIYTAWTLAACYACTLGLAFMLRYRQGKWKTMRVIEQSL